MKAVYITGCLGFIGSYITSMCLELGWYVKGIDKISYAANSSLLDKFKKFKNFIFEQKDINDLPFLSDCDYIINCAAESITENIYIPLNFGSRLSINTFGELWKRLLKRKENSFKKTAKGEILMIKHKEQIKALSFYNGGQWMPIKAITRHKYKGKIIKLKQKWGIIEATPNHSIYSANLILSNPKDNPELLCIRNINTITPRKQVSDNNLLRVIAAYITEGNIIFNKANGSYITEISQKNKKWLEKINKAFYSYFKIKGNICFNKHSNIFRLQISNKKIYEYFKKNCGKYCNLKYFPDWIFNLNEYQQHFFWKCLLEGDGTLDGRYTTTSYKLINQLSFLLSLINIKYKIYEYDRKFYKRSWELKTNLENHIGLSKKTLKKINYNGWVYDLEIDTSHNYACGIGNIVCHNTHVDNSIIKSDDFIHSNIRGVHNLLELIRKNNHFKMPTLIHFSTDEVYGDTLDSSHKETDILKPSNPYSATKASADMLILAWARTYKVPYVIVRPSNNYGIGQYVEKLIPKTCKFLIMNRKIPLHEMGSPKRIWLHAKDTARAIITIIDKNCENTIYNISGDFEQPNIDTVTQIIQLYFGREVSNIQDFLDLKFKRPGHDFRYLIDDSRIRALGWSPLIKFNDELPAIVEYYKNNFIW